MDATTDIDKEFWDVVCSDPELLRSEFDDLIADAWGGDDPTDQKEPRSNYPPNPAADSVPDDDGALAGTHTWALQRGPPAPAAK